MTAHEFDIYMTIKLERYFESVNNNEISYQNLTELSDWFDDFLTWMEEHN